MVEKTSGFHKNTLTVNETLFANCCAAVEDQLFYCYSMALLMEDISAMDPCMKYVIFDTHLIAEHRDLILWCKEFLKSGWQFMNYHHAIVFEDDSDLILFKLHWGS